MASAMPSLRRRPSISRQDAVLDAADVVLGTRVVPLLANGASASATTSLTLPTTLATGTYYFLALADAPNTVNESQERNNTGPASGRQSRSRPAGRQSSLRQLPLPPVAGSASPTPRGIKGGASAASSTGFYLSTNGAVDAADLFLGSRSIGELPAGATSSATTVLQFRRTLPPVPTSSSASPTGTAPSRKHWRRIIRGALRCPSVATWWCRP